MRLPRYLVLLSVVALLIVFALLLSPAAHAQQYHPQAAPQQLYSARPVWTPFRPWLWGRAWSYTPVVTVQPVYVVPAPQPGYGVQQPAYQPPQPTYQPQQ